MLRCNFDIVHNYNHNDLDDAKGVRTCLHQPNQWKRTQNVYTKTKQKQTKKQKQKKQKKEKKSKVTYAPVTCE